MRVAAQEETWDRLKEAMKEGLGCIQRLSFRSKIVLVNQPIRMA
jgi:hypothetical protein